MSVGRVFCVQTFAAHFKHIYARMLCVLFHFVSFHFAFYVHAQYSLTFSNSVGVLFEEYFLIVGINKRGVQMNFKWWHTQKFLFSNVGQSILINTNTARTTELVFDRGENVWQKCGVCVRESIECCYTFKIFTSVLSLAD